jgi:hypothetical protein
MYHAGDELDEEKQSCRGFGTSSEAAVIIETIRVKESG